MKENKGGFLGVLKASRGFFSGHVEADSGTLNNITIRENSLFQGNITSGPLVLSESSPISGIVTYPIGADAQTIYNAERTMLNFSQIDGREFFFNVMGTYGNENIIGIGFLYETIIVNNAPRYKISVFGYFTDSSRRLLAYKYYNYYQVWDNTTLVNGLSIQYVRGGKTVKFFDLPTYDPHTVGALYRNSSGQLFVSLG